MTGRRQKASTLARRLLVAVLLCAPLAVVAPGAAHAFLDIFGWFSRDEPEEVSPDAHPYEIEFQVAGDLPDLESRLRSASQLWAERDTAPPGTAALVARARGDYARILAALYAEARYGGSIAISVEGRAPELIPPDAELPRPAQVQVMVDPGPLFTFRNISIEGRAPILYRQNDHIESPEELGLAPGEDARSRRVLQAEDALIAQWRALGHPKAEITRRDVTADHAANAIDVSIAVAAGPAAVYGPLSVSGTEHMNPDFVARHTGIQPGDAFDPEDIEEGERMLRRLEVFQSARIVEGDEIAPDGTLPMTVNVAERPLRVFGVGGAVSTVDGGSVEGYWQHRNLFGQAERLRFEGRVGGIGVGDWDPRQGYNYFAGTTFVKPGVITPRTDFTAHASARLENLEAYRDRSALAWVGLAHRFDRWLTGEVSARLERSRIEDPFGTRDFLMASVPVRLTYDTRDNELDPTRGVRVWVQGEPFHEVEFRNSGFISEAQASTYYAFDERHRFIIAGRVAAGSIVGAPRDELPASRLFFAGGGGSIRGYAYRNVGPMLPTGEVVGGRSYVTASLEVRARITETIGIVPFIDVGNAFEATFPDFSEELRVGAGLGLRYYTGLGPIRFDIAVPANRRPGDPSVAFYVGIGHSF